MVTRYIRVEKNEATVEEGGENWTMHFAELEAYNTSNENVAINKPSSASSEGAGSVKERGNDGNTSGEWANNSIWHSSGEANPWWEVDLETDQILSKVKIYNRIDVDENRTYGKLLDGVEIKLLTSDRTVEETYTFSYNAADDGDPLNASQEYNVPLPVFEITSMSVGNIEYPSTTSEVRIEFSIPITDEEINSFITNEPTGGSTLSTMTTSDNGKTWTGTLTGTSGYVVKDGTMNINYTGGINASETYNIVMTANGKGWNEIYSITDGINSYTGHAGMTNNKLGTMFALDYNQEKYDASNGVYPLVKVYEKDGTNWNQKGSDLAVSTEKNRTHYMKLNEIGDHIMINMAPSDGTIVYKWDGSSWVQKGTTLNIGDNWLKGDISSDGNTIVIPISSADIQAYEYDEGTSDWITKGSALTAGTSSIRTNVILNYNKTRIAFIKGTDLLTYIWNDGTSDWELVDTMSVTNLSYSGLVSNYGGERVAFIINSASNTYKTEVYDWNGTGYTQVGTSLEYIGYQSLSLALDETGTILIFQYKESSSEWKTKIYKYVGTDWSLSKTIDYGLNISVNGLGDRIFMSNGYKDKSVSIQENIIGSQINEMRITPSEVKFPETTSELRMEFSHNDLTSTEVGTNVSISDVNLGNMGAFVSSEGGYVWTSTFTASNIEGSGTIDYSYSGMTGSVALVVDTLEKAISNICFYGEAKVMTSEGEKEIRKVKKGMMIKGENIEEVTRTISKEKDIVLMKKGSIMKNMPKEDTRITKEHKVLYKGKMMEAKELVNGTTIVYEKYKGETLYNIMLSGEGKMVVNGMIVETLSPSNNIAKLYKILEGYTEDEKREIIKIYNEEKKKKKVTKIKIAK